MKCGGFWSRCPRQSHDDTGSSAYTPSQYLHTKAARRTSRSMERRGASLSSSGDFGSASMSLCVRQRMNARHPPVRGCERDHLVQLLGKEARSRPVEQVRQQVPLAFIFAADVSASTGFKFFEFKLHFSCWLCRAPKAEQGGRGNGDRVSSRGRRPSRRASPLRSGLGIGGLRRRGRYCRG